MKWIIKSLLGTLIIALICMSMGNAAWANEQNEHLIVETSFAQVSKITPLVAVAGEQQNRHEIDNIIYAKTPEEQQDYLRIGVLGSPREKLLMGSSNILESMEEPISAATMTGMNIDADEAIAFIPGTVQGPYDVDVDKVHSMSLDLSNPSLVAFQFARTTGSSINNKLMLSFQDEAGNIAYEWDVDYNETNVIYGDFILAKGIWNFTINATLPAHGIKVKFLVDAGPDDAIVEIEPNGDIPSATPLPFNSTVVATAYDPSNEFYQMGSLFPMIDIDMYTFTLEGESSVRINLLTSGAINYDLSDKSGKTRFAAGNTSNSEDAKKSIKCDNLPAGTYLFTCAALGGKAWGKRYAFIINNIPLQSSVGSGTTEKRTVDIRVRGDHGTTDPAPGTYEVACDDAVEIKFIPDNGYVPMNVWVDGMQTSVVDTLDKWLLPNSKTNQTFEIEYEEQSIVPVPDLPNNIPEDGEGALASNTFLNIALTDLYINGVHEANAPEVAFTGNIVIPKVVAVHHFGPSNFQRLYPADADVGEFAVYHYVFGDVLISQIVTFEKDGDARYMSTEMVFPSEEEAESLLRSSYDNYKSTSFELIDARRVKNATYVQERMTRDGINRATYERVMRSVWETPESAFMSGPDEDSSYVVSFKNNDKAGTGLATATGIGVHFGVKSAEFKIVDRRSSGSGNETSIPGDTQMGTTNQVSTVTSLTQTGEARSSEKSGTNGANGVSTGKTGLVQTGDIVGYGMAAVALITAMIAFLMARKRTAVSVGRSTAVAPYPSISVPISNGGIPSIDWLYRNDKQSRSEASQKDQVVEAVSSESTGEDINDIDMVEGLGYRDKMNKKLPRLI